MNVAGLEPDEGRLLLALLPHFDRPGRSAEAQASYLLAAAAERRLTA